MGSRTQHVAPRKDNPRKVSIDGKMVKVRDRYKVVTTGFCKQYDMFYDLRYRKWTLVEPEDIGLPADTFECLIRK